MDNLRSVIELLFAKRDVNELLNSFANDGKIGEVVEKDAFKKLFRNNDSWYSGDQLNSLFEIVNKTWRKNSILSNSHAGKNLFNILTQMSGEVLTVEGGEPYCKSEEYLRWHDITKSVGEDILVTNYLAAADVINQYTRINFLWQPNLLSDNNEIRRIAENGLADLHCHLYGSAQIGALSWIELMNFPESFGAQMFDILQNMGDGYRKVMLAAFLRVVLFSWVTETSDDDFDNTIQFWLAKQDKLQAVEFIIREIQTHIDYLRYCKTRKEDYAIPDSVKMFSQGIESRIVYSGERWLLYHCFAKINRGESNSVINSMLYIYLNIKSQFRYDMVQVNKDVGFENFMYYDGKKGNFLDTIKLYENEYANSAVNIGVQGTNVKYVEYRITPKDTKQKMFSSIQYLSPYTDELKDKVDYGFIVHFIKKKDDDENYTPSVLNAMRCRNSVLRKNLEIEANNVYEIVCDGYGKIIGIDAANSEFYCRPEVYGPAFRKLRYATPGQNVCYYKPDSIRRLGVTFHVGEDFYDIIDGLRAVDEAIMFLNLRNGDRMGHGTVLGLDAEKFYERINYTVVMPKQVLIDNIVWLLYNIEHCGISDVSPLVEMLKSMYSTYVCDVYGEYINRHIYRKSWLLRGDNPDFYNSDGFIQRGGCLDYQISNCTEAREARNASDACKLYHRYHYDVTVKSNGIENVEFKIGREYQVLFIKVIKEIQKQMQDIVSQRRIAIECNPTSNVRIEHIDKYENHPISKFNNKGLEVRKGDKEWSAQIPATINTDDAGIFATSLEKEFTLMAVALDKAVDENKERKYESQSIYSWLDIIRNNAIKYAFGNSRIVKRTEYYPMEMEKKENIEPDYFKDMNEDDRIKMRDKVQEMRNFHYENFNKWSTYFYIIIGALFVGYYSVAGKSGMDDFRLIILLLGYIVSVFWHLSNKGYVYWELHWTAFLKDIESKMGKDDILYSVFYWGEGKNPEKRSINYGSYLNPIAPASVSTSNITLLMSFIVAVCWGCLLCINWFGVIQWFCECCYCVHWLNVIIMILLVTFVNGALTMGCGYLLKSKVENHILRENRIAENNGYSKENNKWYKDLFRCRLFKDQKTSQE